jgi:hypothetical protein
VILALNGQTALSRKPALRIGKKAILEGTAAKLLPGYVGQAASCLAAE